MFKTSFIKVAHPLQLTDDASYPRRKYIDHHIAKAKLANRLANFYQENVEVLIEKWQHSSEDLFFFRKHQSIEKEMRGGTPLRDSDYSRDF